MRVRSGALKFGVQVQKMVEHFEYLVSTSEPLAESAFVAVSKSKSRSRKGSSRDASKEDAPATKL